jgi:hypothetical protein
LPKEVEEGKEDSCKSAASAYYDFEDVSELYWSSSEEEDSDKFSDPEDATPMPMTKIFKKEH